MLTEREQNFTRHIHFICNTVKHCNSLSRSQFEIKFAFVVWIYDLLQYINESLEYCSKIGNEIRMTKKKRTDTNLNYLRAGVSGVITRFRGAIVYHNRSGVTEGCVIVT